jgi:Domain of unknown function (DUF1772)
MEDQLRIALQILATLVLGLMCGSELNVAAFAHPTMSRQRLEVHVEMRAAMARLLGDVMPFWMSGSTLLNLALLLPFAHLNGFAWRLAATAFALQALAVLFSVILPVPINNRIKLWTVESLPSDWKEQERRWDTYHWIRTVGLIIAFAMLALSIGTH